MSSRVNNVKRGLALIGCALALAVGLAVGGLRAGWIAPQPAASAVEVTPPSGAGLLDGLAFLLVFTVPFALGLFALTRRDPAFQAAIWLAGTVLAFAGATATFSIVTLAGLPIPGVLLALASGMALWQAGIRRALIALGVAVVLIAVGVGAFVALDVRDDPVCWGLVVTESGGEVWRRQPFSTQSPPLPVNPGPGEFASWSCTTDTISLLESVISMGLWALTLLALLGLWPRQERAAPVEAVDQAGLTAQSPSPTEPA